MTPKIIQIGDNRYINTTAIAACVKGNGSAWYVDLIGQSEGASIKVEEKYRANFEYWALGKWSTEEALPLKEPK